VTSTLARLPADQARMTIGLAGVRLRHRLSVPARAPYPWQVPPPQPWDVWLLLGGRGTGKTEAGARYVNAHTEGPACLAGRVPHRIAIVAPSHDDAVDTCVRGETGLLYVNPLVKFHPGAALWSDLTWINGSEAMLFGTFAPEDVERFRGPQHCLIWGDEFAAWRKLDESWAMLEYGSRLGPHPHAVLTTTPKRRPLLKQILSLPSTAITKGRTAEAHGLPETRRAVLYDRYGGTMMGRQELDAEIIEDVEGALWRRPLIQYRVTPETYREGKAIPDLARVVVAIDPAVTSGEDADETGMIVAGLGSDGRGYVLADLTCHVQPAEWAKRAIAALRDFGADRIVAESNNGGDLVRTVIAAVDPLAPVTLVSASRAKRTRAEPIAALYEQGRISHVGPFPELEDQMCSYTGAPGESSPDRLDALVWALSELFGIQLSGEAWGVGGQVWGAS
jgi:phage terminase large subunit-like protein